MARISKYNQGQVFDYDFASNITLPFSLSFELAMSTAISSRKRIRSYESQISERKNAPRSLNGVEHPLEPSLPMNILILNAVVLPRTNVLYL